MLQENTLIHRRGKAKPHTGYVYSINLLPIQKLKCHPLMFYQNLFTPQPSPTVPNHITTSFCQILSPPFRSSINFSPGSLVPQISLIHHHPLIVTNKGISLHWIISRETRLSIKQRNKFLSHYAPVFTIRPHSISLTPYVDKLITNGK